MKFLAKRRTNQSIIHYRVKPSKTVEHYKNRYPRIIFSGINDTKRIRKVRSALSMGPIGSPPLAFEEVIYKMLKEVVDLV